MNKYTFEQRFCKTFNKRLNAFGLKHYALALIVILFVIMYGTRYSSSDSHLEYVLFVGTVIICLYLIIVNVGHHLWMASSFAIDIEGLILKGRFRKTQLIPWTSIIAIDVGTLNAYNSVSTPVIRCFLSSHAQLCMTPNLNNSGSVDSVRMYYKYRKECIVVEYSDERLEAITKNWNHIHNSEPGMHSNSEQTDKLDDGFEYTFGGEVRNHFHQVKIGYVICYYGLVVLGYLITFLVKGLTDRDFLYAIIFLGTPLIIYYALQTDKPTIQWLLKEKCKLDDTGISIKLPKKKMQFIPWDSIVLVERRRMNIDATFNVVVICCYRSYAGKTLLDRAASQSIHHPMHREFYHIRDEVVTLGYSSKRMEKVQALRNESIRRK